MSRTAHVRVLILGGAMVAMLTSSAAQAAGTPPTTKQISVSSTGALANDSSYGQSISANGRYVAFGSTATNLTTGPVSYYGDVFVRDLSTGVTRLVSPQQFKANSQPSLSADGRLVAYTSSDPQLTHSLPPSNVVVRDLSNGSLRTASLSSTGIHINATNDSPSISANGRFVAFRSANNDPTKVAEIFVRDLLLGVTRRISVSSGGAAANGNSGTPTVSADGRYVAFESDASNLVPGDTNNKTDVFVRDTISRTTRRVSVSSHGAQGNGYSGSPSISSDGRHIAFSSSATDLVAGDSNGKTDIFVRDLLTSATRRTSIASSHAQGNGNSDGYPGPVISADGRYTAFTSSSSNLVPGDTNNLPDVFLNDRSTGMTSRVSVSSIGAQADSGSSDPAISGDGVTVAFLSDASNLTPNPANYVTDVFVRSPLH